MGHGWSSADPQPPGHWVASGDHPRRPAAAAGPVCGLVAGQPAFGPGGGRRRAGAAAGADPAGAEFPPGPGHPQAGQRRPGRGRQPAPCPRAVAQSAAGGLRAGLRLAGGGAGGPGGAGLAPQALHPVAGAAHHRPGALFADQPPTGHRQHIAPAGSARPGHRRRGAVRHRLSQRLTHLGHRPVCDPVAGALVWPRLRPGRGLHPDPGGPVLERRRRPHPGDRGPDRLELGAGAAGRIRRRRLPGGPPGHRQGQPAGEARL